MIRIPKIIHFVFLNSKEHLPEVFSKCVERTKSLHPNWRIEIYNEHDAEEIILENLPELLPVFKGYGHYVQRADLFRAILVYIFGGFYMDMDMFCLKPLDDNLLAHNLVLPEERRVSERHRKLQERLDGIVIKNRMRLGNYMFGGTPRHPFWLLYFYEATKKSILNITQEGDVLETTGPSLLTNVYHQYKRRFPEITVLPNDDRVCLMPFHGEICCHFGNYAAHLHQGTWRWSGSKTSTRKFNNLNSHTTIRDVLPILGNRLKQCQSSTVSLVNLSNKDGFFITRLLLKRLRLSTNRWTSQNGNLIILNLNRIDNFRDIDFGQRNVLVITEPVFLLSKRQVSLINRYIVKCFVFNNCDLRQLLFWGIEVEIIKLVPFYLPVKREFGEEEYQKFDRFSVGLFSNLSDQSMLSLGSLINMLRKEAKDVEIRVFYSRGTYSNIIPQVNGIRFCEITSKRFSSQINSLSCFLNMDSLLEEEVIMNTCLYCGIPAMVEEKVLLDERLRKFCSKVDANRLLKYIFDLKNNYLKYNRKSLKAAKYIEDKYSLEFISNKILLASCDS